MEKHITFSSVLKKCLLVVVVGLFMNACADDQVSPGNDNPSIEAKKIGDAEQMQQTFHAHLTGDQERPVPIETAGSGEAIFKLSKDGTSLSYKVIVNNLEGITQSHIHCGGPDVAGPVVAFLFGFDAAGVTVNGVLAEGTITPADIIPRPDTQECMGGLADFAQLIEKIKAGQAYINVHTLAHPPGEIRGAIE